MENCKNIAASSSNSRFFQMPLHYPRYTEKDYQNMPEWQLDMVLAEYGLPTYGDLAAKREFAKGAFLWPDQDPAGSVKPHSSSGTCNKKWKVTQLFCRVLGYA